MSAGTKDFRMVEDFFFMTGGEIMDGLKRMMSRVKEGLVVFHQDNKGLGTVEILLITIVLVGLVVLFKAQIVGLVTSLAESMAEEARSV